METLNNNMKFIILTQMITFKNKNDETVKIKKYI